MSTANYTFDPSKIQLVGGVARLIIPNTSATILINDVFECSSFTSLVEDVNKSGTDDIHYQMKVNGALQYYSSGWTTSDGSFAQSNSAATINTNAASLITGSNKTLQVQAILKGSGTTSPELNNLTVNYMDGPVFSPASGNCVVYCYLEDILGNDLTAAANIPILYAVNDSAFMNNSHVVARFTKSAAFASTLAGLRASIELENTSLSNHKLRFFVNYSPTASSTRIISMPLNPCVIPNQTSADLTAISSIDVSQLL